MYAISSTIMKQPRKAFVVPEARGPMIGRNLIRNCLLVAITSLTLAMAAPGQERTESVLTLDQATELARSHNRELKQAGLEIHKQQEAFSEARTQLYPRFDTYFLGSELLTPLDFTIKSGTLGTFPATGPIQAKDSVIHTPARPVAIASVTVTQPLTQLLRIDLSIRQQRLATELSQQSYLEHQQVGSEAGGEGAIQLYGSGVAHHERGGWICAGLQHTGGGRADFSIDRGTGGDASRE